MPEVHRALLHEIVSGVVRQQGYLDWVLSHFLRKPVRTDIHHLLRIGLYQILFMKKGHHHVVNETVEFVKRTNSQSLASFVNAVLRQCIREHEGLVPPNDPVKRLAVLLSFPEWLVRRWLARFGDDTEALLAACNKCPAFSLFVDERRIGRDALIDHLATKGVQARPGGVPGSVRVDRIAPLLADELFLEGSIQVQDEASQIAGLAVGVAPGEIVLDACAGLGTKSRQMRSLAPGARIVVMDVDVRKVARAGTDLPVAADAARPPFREGLFDAVLLDAPCSSLGVIRKHPEIKWRRREKDIASFGRRQIGLLRSLWDIVRPGGRLVYSVCSFEPEETVEVIEAFARERKFVLEKAPSFLFNKESFLSLPHTTGMDGFFVARLMKP